MEEARSSSRAILGYDLYDSIPPIWREKIVVNGKVLGKAKNLAQFIDLWAAVNRYIDRPSSNPVIHLQFGAHEVRFFPTVLGQGEKGRVFRTTSAHRTVIKIPQGDLVSIVTMLEEKEAAHVWRESKENFRHLTVNWDRRGFGLLPLIERSEVVGETLAETLFRYGVLKIDRTGAVVFGRERRLVENDPEIRKIFDAYQEAIAFVKQRPQIALSLSPFNLMVEYSGPWKQSVQRVVLVDYGPSRPASVPYLQINQFSEFLDLMREKMQAYKDRSRLSYRSVSWDESQKYAFVRLRTLDGKVRTVFGMSEEVHQGVLGLIDEFCVANGIPRSRVYYYGSRVLTREQLLNESPGMTPEQIGLEDDGVRKDSIRYAGTTNLSDLDIKVTVPTNSEIPMSQLVEWRFQAKEELNKKFRVFPLQVLFVPVPVHASAEQEFEVIAAMTRSQNKVASTAQYADSSTVTVPNACEKVLLKDPGLLGL